MSGDDLKAIKARAEAATPGPWYTIDPPWGDGSAVNAGSADPHGGSLVCDCDPLMGAGDGDCLADAAFIAHARQDIPALVDRLEAESERLRTALARCLDLLQSAQWGGYSCPSDVLIDQTACGSVVQAIRAALDETA